MKAEFWHERWENKLIGFHLDEVNPNLTDNWQQFSLAKGKTVFVPLCGKSLDLLWLVEQGYEVIGVELSPLAVEEFFSEHDLKVSRESVGKLEKWSANHITVYCGDIFDLQKDEVGKIDAVYDRASLIALPPEMREHYADKIKELANQSPVLLVTLDYEQDKMDGPPFAVSRTEVETLFSDSYQVIQHDARDVIEENSRFKEKGLHYLNEVVYFLQH